MLLFEGQKRSQAKTHFDSWYSTKSISSHCAFDVHKQNIDESVPEFQLCSQHEIASCVKFSVLCQIATTLSYFPDSKHEYIYNSEHETESTN